ncbi:hypothetical protein C8R45DRAFT_1070135, partial [Mycena sanguinolenta]
MSSTTVSTVTGEPCRTTRRLRDGGNLKNSQVGEEFCFWFIGVGTEARVPQSYVGLPQECCSIWFGLPLRLPQLCHIAADCRTDFAAEKRNIAAVDARLPLQRHKFAAASVNFAAANGILGIANWGTGKEFNICRTFNCHTLPLHIAATAAAPLQRQNPVAPHTGTNELHIQLDRYLSATYMPFTMNAVVLSFLSSFHRKTKMDLRSISSPLSLAKSSVYTTTSSSTQWGPGALTGKAIRAMGKAVVRGAEYIVISRRLSTIRAALPCRDENHEIRERMFDDVLELSRPGLYPEAFRIQSMQILVAQIASEDTYHLQCSFSKWEIDHEELVALLSEIIGVVLFSKRGFTDERLVNAYMMALPQHCHPWLPCVAFMAKIAQINHNILHAVSMAKSQTVSKNPLTDACSEAFALLSQPAHDLYVLWVEQIGGLESEDSVTSLSKVLAWITAKDLWPMVEARLLGMHADAMLTLMVQHRPSYQIHDPTDLLPWATAFHSKASLSALFIRNFLRCVGLGGDVHDTTVNYLSGLTYKKKMMVLASMIEHLIVQSYVDPSTVESFMILFTPETPDIANNIVQFLIVISNAIIPGEEVLLDAALLIIVRFVQPTWDPLSIFEDIYRRIRKSKREVTPKKAGWHQPLPVPELNSFSLEFRSGIVLQKIPSSCIWIAWHEMWRAGWCLVRSIGPKNELSIDPNRQNPRSHPEARVRPISSVDSNFTESRSLGVVQLHEFRAIVSLKQALPSPLLLQLWKLHPMILQHKTGRGAPEINILKAKKDKINVVEKSRSAPFTADYNATAEEWIPSPPGINLNKGTSSSWRSPPPPRPQICARKYTVKYLRYLTDVLLLLGKPPL